MNSVLSAPFNLPLAVIPVSEVEAESRRQLDLWLAEGRHAGMEYMTRYPQVRNNPALLLDGAKSMVIVALPYLTASQPILPIANYALKRDYHEVAHEVLSQLGQTLGGEFRVCVDSAPLRERYWAQRAGLGRIGRNNQLFVPPYGSYVFIATLLTTVELSPQQYLATPEHDDCPNGCRRCIEACPGGCLSTTGEALDARSCHSYLTIEHRGALPDNFKPRTLFGCEICQRVCPRNASAQCTPLPQFAPLSALLTLTAADLRALTNSAHRRLVAHTPLRRTPLPQLLHNLSLLKE